MAGPVKDKEAYQRLNYLYQAAHCVLSQNPENVELARFYCFTQKTIARRLVLRQDPSVKRALCKKCCSLLVPGVTATSRQRRKSPRLSTQFTGQTRCHVESQHIHCWKNSQTRFTVVRCLSCGHRKTLLNNPEHRLWVDQPEAQLESHKQSAPGPSPQVSTKDTDGDGSPSTKSSVNPAGS
ncbi:ribonuclease P protein subunit p21 [Myripristis murdjan]|uniref:ribonuclease P protein subunit p21 n=1 Tax=Myripristis murdjan TaxID=586833 RepID=UPI001175E87A|nr:ribonuclease P protein subunit p21-like [Myripristis murdjan]